MNRTVISPHVALRLAIVLAALVDRARRVDGLVDGDHYFRQAHVLANVDKLLADGLFSTPATWNRDLFLHFYDFPLFQGLVATIARTTGGSPGLVAEWLNVAALLALLLATWRIGTRLGVGALATSATLALLALSPLGRFWFAAPTIDPFAVALSTVSLAAWLELRALPTAARAARVAARLTWLGAAGAVTLTKSPIYAPVALVIVATIVRERGLAGLLRPGAAAFLGTLAVAQGTFLAVSAAANANAQGWPDRATELAWYFGSLDERLSLGPHLAILERLAKQVLSVPVAVVTVAAAAAARGWPVAPGTRPFVLTWSLGAVACSLLFLHVNVVHGYYQLPCLAPLSLLGGVGLAALVGRLRGVTGAWARPATAVALLALAAAATWSSERYLRRLRAPSTAAWREAGAFVQAHTAPRDFVLYARPDPDDNPVYLYCAQRDGANVHGDLSPARLVREWHRVAAARGGELVLFLPHDLATDVGAAPFARGAPGRLVRLP